MVFTFCILHGFFPGCSSQFLLTCCSYNFTPPQGLVPWKQHHVCFNVFLSFCTNLSQIRWLQKKALKKDQRPKGWNLQHSFFSGRVLQPTTNKQKHCTLIGKLRKKKIQAEIHHFGLIESLRGLRFNVALQIFSNGKCYRKCRQLGKKSQQWFSQTFAGWKSESEFSWNRIEAGQPCVRSWDIKKRFFFIRDPD